MILFENGHLYICINGVYLLKPININNQLASLGHAMAISIKSMKLSPSLSDVHLILLVEPTQDSKSSNCAYYHLKVKTGLNNSDTKDLVVLHADLTLDLLTALNSIKSNVDEINQTYLILQDELNSFRALRSKFLQILLDNGLESSTTIFTELLKLLLAGSASDASMQFFLTKIKQKELRKHANEFINGSKLIIQKVISTQNMVEAAIAKLGKYRASVLIMDSVYKDFKTDDFFQNIMSLMWLYARLEQFIIATNNRCSDFALVIGWLIYVYKDLESQNSMAQKNQETEAETIHNPYSSKVVEVSESLCHFFGTEQEIYEYTSIPGVNQTRLRGSAIHGIYDTESIMNECHSRYFELFIEPLCPAHLNINQCFCIEDGVPNDLLGGGISRKDIVELYFDFVYTGCGGANVSSKAVNSAITDLHKVFSKQLKENPMSDFEQTKECLNKSSQLAENTAYPLITIHSEQISQVFSKRLQTQLLVCPPTVIEAVDYTATALSNMLESLIPDLKSINQERNTSENRTMLKQIINFSTNEDVLLNDAEIAVHKTSESPVLKVFFSLSAEFVKLRSGMFQVNESVVPNAINFIASYEIPLTLENETQQNHTIDITNTSTGMRAGNKLVLLSIPVHCFYRGNNVTLTLVDSIEIVSFKRVGLTKAAALFFADNTPIIWLGILALNSTELGLNTGFMDQKNINSIESAVPLDVSKIGSNFLEIIVRDTMPKVLGVFNADKDQLTVFEVLA